MGRSGVPGTIRYAAHENGLMGEDLTQAVIEAYATISDTTPQGMYTTNIWRPMLPLVILPPQGMYTTNIWRPMPPLVTLPHKVCVPLIYGGLCHH